MPTTPDEKMKKLDDEIKQLKSRKQTLLNKEKQKQRKERTRNLIKCGELAEKYFALQNISPEYFEKFLKKFFEMKGQSNYVQHVKKSLR